MFTKNTYILFADKEKALRCLKLQGMTKLLTIFDQCKRCYDKIIVSTNPVIKLQSYLEIVRLILSQSQPSIDVTSFCLQLLFVLIKIGATEMEREADIMWKLLEPNMIEGEIKFYLALLHSTLNDERLCELQVAKEADKNKVSIDFLPC